jgi:hypothetical protein
MFVYAKALKIPNAEIPETRRGNGNGKVARCHVLLGAAGTRTFEVACFACVSQGPILTLHGDVVNYLYPSPCLSKSTTAKASGS